MLPRLRSLIDERAGQQTALEAVWALYVSGVWNDDLAAVLFNHPDPDIRAWAVRLVGDEHRDLSEMLHDRLIELAAREPDVTVRSQLACTAKRLTGPDGLPIVEKLLARGEDVDDPHLPLLLWWAIEDKVRSDREEVLQRFASRAAWQLPIARSTVIERLARRYLVERLRNRICRLRRSSNRRRRATTCGCSWPRWKKISPGRG